jgi:hypothetical protein
MLPSYVYHSIASRQVSTLPSTINGESPAAGGWWLVASVVTCLTCWQPETDGAAATTTNVTTSMARYGAPIIDASTIAIF